MSRATSTGHGWRCGPEPGPLNLLILEDLVIGYGSPYVVRSEQLRASRDDIADEELQSRMEDPAMEEAGYAELSDFQQLRRDLDKAVDGGFGWAAYYV